MDKEERKDRAAREYFSMSDAQYEARGMPPEFKEHGYFQPRQRANLVLVREHLQNAMQAGLNSEALSFVIKAIREIERE